MEFCSAFETEAGGPQDAEQRSIEVVSQMNTINACGPACVLMLLRDRGRARDITPTIAAISIGKHQQYTNSSDLARLIFIHGEHAVIGLDARYPLIELVDYEKLPDTNKLGKYVSEARDSAGRLTGWFRHWIVRISDTQYYDPLHFTGAGQPLTADIDAAVVQRNYRVGIMPAPPQPEVSQMDKLRIKAGFSRNVRVDPTTTSRDIGTLEAGTILTVTDKRTSTDPTTGGLWYFFTEARREGEKNTVENAWIWDGGALESADMPIKVVLPVVITSPPPAPPPARAGAFVGMHDFPDPGYWVKPDRRGWVLHTVKMDEGLPADAMRAHRQQGGRVCIRVNWDYGMTVPADPADVTRFVNWVDAMVAGNHADIDAIQIGNEPDIELQGRPASYLADVHTRVAMRIQTRAPHILISPAPLGWLMPIDGRHPREYFEALWRGIRPEHRTLAVLHAYRHGARGNPDQVFTDDPLTGMHYNERSIEEQMAALNAVSPGLPVLVGEWNYGAPERAGEPDAWQDDDAGATVAMARYFHSLSQVIGVCPFRWKHDRVDGRSYGIAGKQHVIARLREAQEATS